MSWNEIANSQQQSNGSGSTGEVEYIKFKPGKNTIRVAGEEPYSRWVHFIPQANNGKGTSVDCIGKGCPVCAAMAADKKAGRTAKYSSKKGHAIDAFDRGDENKLKILDQGNSVFTQLATLMQNMGSLKNYDVNVIKTGEKMNTKYQVLPVFPPTPLTDAEQAAELHDIPSLYKKLTPAQIVELMNGKSMKDVFDSAADSTASSEAPRTDTRPASYGAPDVNFGAAIAD